jgi:signal transduction histidine kinase
MLNPPLFEWVLENLMKNALDAMEGTGEIQVTAFQRENYVNIDITDTGKGILKNNLEQIFEPGFSTKKRGWGLGLTLARRIIEEYHHGKIFVKDSSPKGTTFRIILKTAE